MLNFNIYENLEKVNANSLLIESGTEIASLQVDNIYLDLMCYGEITVNYKDKVYKRPCDYPKEITDFLLGKIDTIDDSFYISDNNWYQAEIFVVTDNKDYKLDSIELINGCADTFDIELDNNRPLSEQLYHILLDYLKELKQEYKNSVPELAKLNLKNL